MALEAGNLLTRIKHEGNGQFIKSRDEKVHRKSKYPVPSFFRLEEHGDRGKKMETKVRSWNQRLPSGRFGLKSEGEMSPSRFQLSDIFRTQLI